MISLIRTGTASIAGRKVSCRPALIAGNPLLQTPNLDSLVERGMTFTHCYTMGSMIGAVCTPSRTMMLTGLSWQRIPGAPAAAPNAADPTAFLPRVIPRE